MSEITDLAFKLENLDIQSELGNMILLNFCDDVYELNQSLENYPFLKLDDIEPSLVYVDKDYKEEYISAYKTGEMKITEDSLDMFSVDELFTVCNYLTKLEENRRNAHCNRKLEKRRRHF